MQLVVVDNEMPSRGEYSGVTSSTTHAAATGVMKDADPARSIFGIRSFNYCRASFLCFVMLICCGSARAAAAAAAIQNEDENSSTRNQAHNGDATQTNC